MKRRAFLTALAATTSGCSANGGIGGSRKPPDGATEPPPFPDADEVTYPASGRGGISLTVDPRELSLPDATVTVEVSNRSVQSFETSLYDWRFHKRVDDRWWFLDTFYPLDEPYSVGPLGTHTRNVHVDNGDLEQDPLSLAPSTDSSFTLAGIGAGTYAFSHVGGHGNVTRAVSTPFEVTGEQIDLVPLPPLETTRDAEDERTIRVTDADSDEEPRYEITARIRADAGGAPRLASEWGLRQRGVRNTVPFLGDDVRTVVYSSHDYLAYDMDIFDGRRFTCGDRVVEFAVRNL